MRQGFYSPYFIVPKKGGGLRPILDLRVLIRALHKLPFKMRTHRASRCGRAGALSNASSPRIGLQRSTWRMLTFMFRSFCDTDCSYGLRSKVGHGSTGPPLRALPVSPCVHEGRRRRPYPVTGSGRQDPQLSRRLAYPSPIQRAVGRSQGLGASAPQPVGASGQLGEEQALPCAENLFSRCEIRLGEYDGTPHGVPLEAGMWYYWNSFRGSWGIWHPQLQSRHSNCFIWDHFSTGYTPGSRGGHGAAVHCEWVSPSSVAAPSAPGRTLPFYGPGCP